MSDQSASENTNADSLNLDRQLCFALYASSRAMTRAYQPMLRAFGITYPQYLVLLLLWQWESEGRERERCTVSALGEGLMLDSGTLTPLLKRMAGQGLLTRRRGDTDERVTLIALTEKARVMQPKVKAWRDSAARELSMTSDRLRGLHKELWALLNALQSGE